MASDIRRLEDDAVTADGMRFCNSPVVVNGVLYCNGSHIELDNGSRGKISGGHRRALVHDFNDGLTLNWSGGYPGGVTVRGKVQCPDALHRNSALHPSAALPTPANSEIHPARAAWERGELRLEIPLNRQPGTGSTP